MFEITGKQSTMIGSLPYKTSKDTYGLLKKYPLSIPAWPQLPKRSFKEAMVYQYSEGFPGITIDENNKKIFIQRDNKLTSAMTTFYENVLAQNIEAFSVSEEYAEGFHIFIKDLENRGAKYQIIKGQVTGPFTFGLGLSDNTERAVWFDEQYRDIVLKGLSLKACWQIKQLKKYAENVILFFDEPILSAIGTPAYMGISDQDIISGLNEVINAIKAADVLAGVHCCGNMDWGLLARTKVDIISFDAYYYGDKLALYPAEISAFLKRGGILAWGLVPTKNSNTLQKLSLADLKQKKDELSKIFINKGIKEEIINKQIIYTPSCGMGSGSLTLKEAEIILKLLKEISNS